MTQLIARVVRTEEALDSPIGDNNARSAATQPSTLAGVVAVFQRRLYLPDATPLIATLACIAGNRLPGRDPIWLILVGASSSGKTEILQSTMELPDMYSVGTLTEASLLTGTSVDGRGNGGLLRTMGDRGFLICKDFGSVLNMNRTARAAVLAALRELYDGSWTRNVATDGGQGLRWAGKLGVLAASTTAIDQHHKVMSLMGERFIFCRIDVVDPLKQAARALEDIEEDYDIQRELSDTVAGFFATLDFSRNIPPMTGAEKARLASLATLAAQCRSPVLRSGTRREIESSTSEAPARLTKALARLWAGSNTIGADLDTTWRLLVRVAMDSMPVMRRAILNILINNTVPINTTTIVSRIGTPAVTVRRSLEDLEVHQIVTRYPGGPGREDTWMLSDFARSLCDEVGLLPDLVQKDGALS